MPDLNNLYPPLFEQTFIPAFLIKDNNSKCRIYFAISPYNTEDELHEYAVQLTVQKQKTNQSALSRTKYPSGIKICQYVENSNVTDNYKYYIELLDSDIEGGFLLNQYYKIQIRFTGAGAANIPAIGMSLQTWINQNIQYFSEWSTVSLIYGISTPGVTLKNFNNKSVTTFNYIDVPIYGKIAFQDIDDIETLNNYQIYLYDKNRLLLEDSGIKYAAGTENINEINYKIKYNLQRGKNYILKLCLTTKHLYYFEKQYEILIANRETPILDAQVNVQPNNEEGFLRVILSMDNINAISGDNTGNQAYTYDNQQDLLTGKSLYLNFIEPDVASFKQAVYLANSDRLILSNGINSYFIANSYFIIRRTSNKSNFNIWENISTIIVQEQYVTKIIFDDFTVQPGTWYKYEITQYNQTNQPVGYIQTNENMIYTDNIFLSAEDKQLKIVFNPQITNFSIKTSDNLIETIGSQYPYIRREGNIYYKTFTLSGLITHIMDANNIFFKPSEQIMYQSKSAELYDNYNKQHGIGIFNDYIKQRQFRNKVIEFLYADNIKLFRSLTEGNLLIRLMNISLTPNTTLGRLIYSFSCTAYEVDKNEYERYIKHKTKVTKQQFIGS